MANKYEKRAEELLQGAYDLHVHAAPSHTKRSVDDFEIARDAGRAGMGGILIKNHYEPTEARAEIANRHSGSAAKLYGAVALNWPAGGNNPYAVYSCLALGGKLVWMATRDSANSRSFGDMGGELYECPGISACDESGGLKPEVFEVLEAVRQYDAFIATGHLSPAEAHTLCIEARKMNVNTILTHPDWYRTKIDVATQVEISKLGVLVEKVWINVTGSDITAPAMAASMREIGADRVFMVTDRGQAGEKHPVDEMQSYIACMLEQGLSEDEILRMTQTTPKTILRI
jgi:hypothetical protein